MHVGFSRRDYVKEGKDDEELARSLVSKNGSSESKKKKRKFQRLLNNRTIITSSCLNPVAQGHVTRHKYGLGYSAVKNATMNEPRRNE